MELRVTQYEGKSYYGYPDRWHDVDNKMYLVTSNTLIRELNRIYLEADARERYDEK